MKLQAQSFKCSSLYEASFQHICQTLYTSCCNQMTPNTVYAAVSLSSQTSLRTSDQSPA